MNCIFAVLVFGLVKWLGGIGRSGLGGIGRSVWLVGWLIDYLTVVDVMMRRNWRE